MKKCNQAGCRTCPHVREGKTVYSSANNFKVEIRTPVTCTTENVVYVITCNKRECKYVQYVGETGKKLKDRFSQHLGHVISTNANQNQTTTGEHFNLPGHNISNNVFKTLPFTEKSVNPSLSINLKLNIMD